MKCLSCNEEIKKGKKYCNQQCQSDYAWKRYVCRVDEEKVFFNCVGIRYNGGNGPKRAKRYIIEKNGHQCMVCKHTEWLDQPIPLTLDHVDGNPDNWKLDNLRVICPNCDRLQPTYGGRNKGNGKESNRTKRRMKRYYARKES